jgi:ectoine hydroxylase-related dioxygenase (phytanoyl-CoA dioxygenase family)
VTANLAVDLATVENGCLEVVPGSDRMDTSYLKGVQIHPDWEAAHDWVPVPLEPGMYRFLFNMTMLDF